MTYEAFLDKWKAVLADEEQYGELQSDLDAVIEEALMVEREYDLDRRS